MQKASHFYRQSVLYIRANKTVSITLGTVLILAVYHFFFSAPAATVTYQSIPVRRGDLVSTLSVSGQVSPVNQIDIKPRVGGTVLGVYAVSGQTVATGTVLVRLDARDAVKAVRDAQLALDQAKLDLAKAKEPPQTIDVLQIKNAITKATDSKVQSKLSVQNAYQALLNATFEATPKNTGYTDSQVPTVSGSYLKSDEGQIIITTYQTGAGYAFLATGLVNAQGLVSLTSPQPLGDSGLYIKFAGAFYQTDWIINIPNKKASNYLSLYNSYQNAIQSQKDGDADADRTIAENTQKLADLQAGTDAIDLQSKELAVEQKQNALIDAQNNLYDYTVVAPFSGTLASVTAQRGDNTSAGTAIGTIITDRKIATITLNEIDVAKVRLGQDAKLTFDAIPGLTLPGRVEQIDTLGTVTQGVVTYKVDLSFDGTDDRIKPSMSVNADIITESKNNVLLVPIAALTSVKSDYYAMVSTTQPAASDNASTINATTTASTSQRMRSASSSYRRSNSGGTTSTTAPASRRVKVTLGAMNDTEAEVVDGLNEGDVLIVQKTVKPKTTTSTQAPSLFGSPRVRG